MSRSTQEWVASQDDQAVPERVQLRIWRNQMDADGVVHCGISGEPIQAGDKKHLHHKLALCLGGQHRESNLVWALAVFNMEEAKNEVAVRAKNDARTKAHVGIKGKPTSLSVSRAEREARKAERSKDRVAPGKPPVPGWRALYQGRNAG